MTPSGFVAVHAIIGIIAFGGFVFPGIYFTRIAKSRNVSAVRETFPIAQARARLHAPAMALAAVLGFVLAWKQGIPLSSGWLIASYVDYAILLVVGIGFHGRWERRVLKSAQDSPPDRPSAELIAAIDDPVEAVCKWISMVGWLLLLYFMIAKPF